MNILFETSAIEIVCKRLGIVPEQVISINHSRYALIKLTGQAQDKYGEWIAILLKEEPFFNFGKFFADIGEKGVGDSINVEHLKEMLQRNVENIFTLFRDGKLYTISMNNVLNNSHRWMQKEGTMVRSFSIHHYERMEE